MDSEVEYLTGLYAVDMNIVQYGHLHQLNFKY